MSETAVKQDVAPQNWNINRLDILERIFSCAEWLEGKAKQKRCVGMNKITAMRGAIYGYSIVLQGLRDLEIEDIIRRLERLEKLAGIVK